MSGFNLSALAVRERSVTLFAILLISIAGVVAFFQLGRAADPAFTVKAMTVVTAWPGATAQEMQDQVAERLEKRLQELRWYDRSETFTRPGVAFTLVQLRDDMPPSEVQSEFYQVRKKMGDEARSLPAGVIDRLVLVMLAVKLDEQAELKPHKVDARDEATFGIFDDVLSNGIAREKVTPRRTARVALTIVSGAM